MKKFALAIHGGAGVAPREKMTKEMELRYRAALLSALKAGYRLLESGGAALDAVEAAVCALEDDPLFNAGRGAVFNHEGKHEMDASIMNGADLAAGAVSGINRIKNPVKLAKMVMQQSEHVMLSGRGAEEFAREKGIEFCNDEYFFTQHRYDQLQRAKEEGLMQLDDGSTKKFGTVGAVAFDSRGNLAAATSTGGLTNKRFGRVGDSPIIGAGTYANNKTCAVSCTGHGEYFIRNVTAYDIHALMEYRQFSLHEAARYVVMEKLVAFGGEGGVIAVDNAGNIGMPFNSGGMYRASAREDEEMFVSIY